jgi:hypothetical protein
MSPIRLCFVRAVALLLLSGVPAAFAQPAGPATPDLSDETELARAVTLYEAGRYEECATEFDELLGTDGGRKLQKPEIVERARVYFAACLIATKRDAQASEQFRIAIRANPRMRPPDSLVFPQIVLDLFFRVRDSLLDEIKKAEEERLAKAREAAERAAKKAAAERARVRRLEEYARQEVVITKNERWLAAVPFGVGQFQNGDTALGWIFFGAELALAGTALTAMVVELQLHAQTDDTPRPDPVALNQNLETWHDVLVVTSWGFLAVSVTGVVQAQIAFKPEFREQRRRPLPRDVRPQPPEAWLRPVPLATPDGLGLGVVGRF